MNWIGLVPTVMPRWRWSPLRAWSFRATGRDPIRAAHGAGHGYHPELQEMMTSFVAAGAGVRPGTVVPMLPLQHVAAFVAALLGIDMPETDGTLLPGLLFGPRETEASGRP